MLVSQSDRSPADSRIRLAFLIRSLNRGGSERQLAELAAHLDPRAFDVLVLTFYPGGGVWEELVTHPTVRLESLHKRGRWDIVACAWHLARVLRAWRADILHTYLVEPSIYGLLATRLAPGPAVVWAVRASNIDFSLFERINRVTFRVAAWLSRFADLIVANSEAGRTHHVKSGYASARFITIQNGIDTNRFRPAKDARTTARAAWKVADDQFVVGVSARLDPLKDHPTLLKAIADLCRQFPNVRLVCCGAGSDEYLRNMRILARDLGIFDRVLWVGEEPQMEAAYAGFDSLCSSSTSEGFSNSIAEAMACGVPCVVTDVGDSAEIVGDTGYVVPAHDPQALARALATLLVLTPSERSALGERARVRIVTKYQIATMVARTTAMYRKLAATKVQDLEREKGDTNLDRNP